MFDKYKNSVCFVWPNADYYTIICGHIQRTVICFYFDECLLALFFQHHPSALISWNLCFLCFYLTLVDFFFLFIYRIKIIHSSLKWYAMSVFVIETMVKSVISLFGRVLYSILSLFSFVSCVYIFSLIRNKRVFFI